MDFEFVSSVLASFGGATVIVGSLSHFLGGVWARRIAAQTVAKFEMELETTKAANKLALDAFKIKSEENLKERDQYNGISFDVYQGFIENRVKTYTNLLSIVNEYISKMHEDIRVEESESWGDAYYSIYVSLRDEITKNQLYISNELEVTFHRFRLKSAKYVKEADLEEVHAIMNGAHQQEADEQKCHVYDKFARETQNEMISVITAIKSDVSKLRSRIEIDKA
ncbi:hypothetical protein L1D26_22490 [Vibrio mediterranei]|uniref:hypothetical protein n=1 Tax=Vibrio mediterranei TaxID=689 RepID=UPI001EFC8E8F|nr:hypothetical protein [Vibrio mediterranei]MCG9665822.1 hypothetical protein [Vibrio mediterranei]